MISTSRFMGCIPALRAAGCQGGRATRRTMPGSFSGRTVRYFASHRRRDSGISWRLAPLVLGGAAVVLGFTGTGGISRSVVASNRGNGSSPSSSDCGKGSGDGEWRGGNENLDSPRAGETNTNKAAVVGVLSGLVFGGGVLGFFLLGFLATRFRRCPPNKILVVSGKGAGCDDRFSPSPLTILSGGKNAAKTLHGGGAIVIPVWQEHGYISLDPMQISCDLRKALSLENIRINVPSVFTIAVTTDPALLQNAAQRLLGISREEIASQARDIIFGQLRQVIASMKIEEINKSREKFTMAVSQNIETELQKLGLTLINVNITDITDESGYLEAMGRKAAREAIESANIDESEQTKRGAMGVAQNVKEKDVYEAEQRFLTTQARAELERENRIAVAAANGAAIEGENKARMTVAQSEAVLKVKMAEAYQESRLAEVRVEEETARAEARLEETKAALVEATERSKLEAPAKAKKAELLVEAHAEAERMCILAEGRAKSLILEADALAYAELEKLRRKGEGLGHIVREVGGASQAFKLLMLEHMDHLADASAQAISNIKFDKVVVWDGANGNSTSDFVKNVAASLPPAMHMLRDVGGVELPKYLASFTADEKADNEDVRKGSTEPPQGEKNESGR